MLSVTTPTKITTRTYNMGYNWGLQRSRGWCLCLCPLQIHVLQQASPPPHTCIYARNLLSLSRLSLSPLARSLALPFSCPACSHHCVSCLAADKQAGQGGVFDDFRRRKRPRVARRPGGAPRVRQGLRGGTHAHISHARSPRRPCVQDFPLHDVMNENPLSPPTLSLSSTTFVDESVRVSRGDRGELRVFVKA